MGLIFYKTSVSDQNRKADAFTTLATEQDAIGMRWEDGKEWYFPLEPTIEISGGNTIVRRNVLKVDPKKARRGSIKELWQQDDYEITISGLITTDETSVWEEYDLMQLRNFCEERRPVYLIGKPFSTLRISRCVIDSWSLPATIGEDLQSFSLKLYSDDEYELLIEL